MTCHDGFTLNDLVSYNQKHNEENGEQNRDGMDDNHSWNCGAEGPVDDPGVEALRCRQIRNFFVLNMLSIGTPMLLMGDELRRSQLGNNNAYCQDNEISWLDWGLQKRHGNIHRFVRMMIAFRARRDVVIEDPRLTLNELLKEARLQWHGVALNHPDWSEESHSIAFTVASLRGRFNDSLNVERLLETSHLCLAYSRGEGQSGRRWIDTSLPCPDDICTWKDATSVTGTVYPVDPRSLAVLLETAQ